MTQKLIDKSAVVAEMENCYNECIKRAEIVDADYWNAKADAYRNVLAILDDTIEIKEVDFDKEINEWMKYGPHTSYPWCTIPDAIKITAEHFFELGLKTKNNNESIHRH